jgi:hypothetical protein
MHQFFIYNAFDACDTTFSLLKNYIDFFFLQVRMNDVQIDAIHNALQNHG